MTGVIETMNKLLARVGYDPRSSASSDSELPDLQQGDGTGRSRLTGWEAVEDHFVKHDQGLVDGFNDDINTLLTFVRIFPLSN